MAMRRFADRAALVTAMLLAASVFAQSPQPAATFEAADVRAAAPNPSPNNAHGGALRGDRYEIRNITMLGLIGFAYGMDDDHVVGGPSWLEMNRFDIAALAPPNTPMATIRVMLRTLLADRFELVVHEDKQQMTAFVLTASVRTRLRARQEAGGKPNCEVSQRPQANGTALKHMVCTNMNMAALAARLPTPAIAADYIPADEVVNQTGLAGAWDFELDWTPREQLARAGAEAVTLQQALESIGLRLEEEKVATSVLVVDSVNATPTPNAADITAKLPPLPPPQFEVATVKPSPPEATTSRARLLPTGQVEFTATPLRQMMNFAWQVPSNEYLVAPNWVESRRYDVVARAYATPVTEAWRDGDRLLLMLRQLIADRFQMKFHMETRSVGAFVLSGDNPKMAKADPATRTRCVGTAATGRNPALTRLITCQNVTMAQFAELLPEIVNDYLKGPVADMTGIEGAWDFTVNYSPQSLYNPSSGGGGDAGAASTPTGALSIFDAIDRQLGLTLRPQRRSLPVMVVDSISEEVAGN
jgi:uncharacterized protein (TIGR03435 family)